MLPAELATALRAAKQTIGKDARGMLYNAKIADLIGFLGLVKTHTKDWPSKGIPSVQPAASPSATPNTIASPPAAQSALAGGATETTAPTDDVAVPTGASTGSEQLGLAVLLLDQSVDDPFSGDLHNACSRLQDEANELLKQISKLTDGTLEVAIVSYGLDGSGETEVRDTFDGPLAGQSVVAHNQLAAGALRVDEYDEQVSNGLGGLVTLTRKKPIYFDLEPTAAAAPQAAFAAVARIVGAWCQDHPGANLPPIVLHLTRGQVDGEAIRQALSGLTSLATAGGSPLLYHLILTETPHKSLAYPASDGQIQEPLCENSGISAARFLERGR